MVFCWICVAFCFQYISKPFLLDFFLFEDLVVLEVGTHHGYTTRVLAAVARKVLALDISRENLDVAAQVVGDLAGKVTFLQMDSLAEAPRKSITR